MLAAHSRDFIKSMDTFHGVPEQQLDWLADEAEYVAYNTGEFMLKTGDPIEFFVIIEKGHFRLYREQAGSQVTVLEMKSGDITGMLPFSRAVVTPGYTIALEPTGIIRLPKNKLREMVAKNYELTEVLVHRMTTRVREFTTRQQQDEKMMSLGKLSAGLAHELNNPSAAIIRSASTFRNHLASSPDAFKAMMKMTIDDGVVDKVNNYIFQKIKDGPVVFKNLMDKMDKEDALMNYLEDVGYPDAQSATEALLSYGVTTDELDILGEWVGENQLIMEIRWLRNVLTSEKLVDDICISATRISELVNSVKTFTHMDQAPELSASDITSGINSALTILQHKCRKNNVSVNLNFDEDLPLIRIFVGQMNQVWTNLLDNALDAMEEKGGQLDIAAKVQDNQMMVTIHDQGVGIPENIINKIFDPFFTTKPVGKGTGLGLEITRNIIQRHTGHIEVKSVPGSTTFAVFLPLNN